MQTQHGALADTLDELAQKAEKTDGDTVKVGDLVDALDERGYGPVLAVLPLVEMSPLGGIPGFPTLLAFTLALITGRLFMGYEHFWVPGFIRKRHLSQDRVEKSVQWLRPVTARIDAKLHERMKVFAGDTARKVACVVILVLLAGVPPLELIPFATTAPMLVIAIFGLGLLYRDGLLMLIGFVGAAVAAAGGLWTILGG